VVDDDPLNELRQIIANERAAKAARSRAFRARIAQDPEYVVKLKEQARIRERRRTEKYATRPKPDACEICSVTGGRIAFDHDHATGKFRGWLCTGCNVAIAMVREQPEILEKLIIYLRTHKGK
jgi:hypothetical protein